MMPAKDDQGTTLSRNLLHALDNLSGRHPGFRPVHAKGILLSGEFTPSPSAGSLTRAPHLQRETIPVSVRFSDFAGIPAIPDNSPDASPRGMAIRFHLAEHVHTDIIAHSVDGFPTRTAEEFLEFLTAAYASASATSHPTPIEAFLGSHPSALEFVQAPKPFPTSFVRETYFGVNAYQFTSRNGTVRFGRYRIRPEAGSEYLGAEAAAAQSVDYLLEEMKTRLATGPTKLRIVVQVAAAGDVVDNSTVHWPAERPEVEFGTLQLLAVSPDSEAEQRHIIFDPIPRVDGIDPSADPLLEPRANVYLMSGRRRRKDGAS